MSAQIKVYELAKELGLSPLALMDKIHEWNIPVKSHMADIDLDLAEKIRMKVRSEILTTPVVRTTIRKKKPLILQRPVKFDNPNEDPDQTKSNSDSKDTFSGQNSSWKKIGEIAGWVAVGVLACIGAAVTGRVHSSDEGSYSLSRSGMNVRWKKRR